MSRPFKKILIHLQSDYNILFQGRKSNNEILRIAAFGTPVWANRQDDMKV